MVVDWQWHTKKNGTYNSDKKAGCSLEIQFCFGKSGIWLIGQRPHHNGGVVLVPSNHLLHHFQVVGQGGVVKVLSTAAASRREEGLHTGRDVCSWACSGHTHNGICTQKSTPGGNTNEDPHN